MGYLHFGVVRVCGESLDGEIVGGVVDGDAPASLGDEEIVLEVVDLSGYLGKVDVPLPGESIGGCKDEEKDC